MGKIDKTILKHRICCICGKGETRISNSGSQVWNRCKCGKKDCTGWLCDNCYSKVRHDLPDSYKNIIKSTADFRNNQLDPLSTSGKGFICAQIVAMTYGLDNCNVVMDNFRFYIDLSKHSEHGYIEVKGATLNLIYCIWGFGDLWHRGDPSKKKFDNIFLVCMDNNKPWKDVKRVYVIPKKEAIKRSGISIYENPSRITWYEDFRIDEKTFNDTYHKMDIRNCKILRKYK